MRVITALELNDWPTDQIVCSNQHLILGKHDENGWLYAVSDAMPHDVAEREWAAAQSRVDEDTVVLLRPEVPDAAR